MIIAGAAIAHLDIFLLALPSTTMSAGEALDDDYIISLLQRDADDHRKRYSIAGNGPLLTTAKRRPDAPKPNTRFLKNIIRETDSHNAALKVKEEGESRARLRELKGKDSQGKRKREEHHADEPGGKRRRETRESRPGRWASALGLAGASNRSERNERSAEKYRRERGQEYDDEETGKRRAHRHRHRRERSHRDHQSEHSSREWKVKDHDRPTDTDRSTSHRKEHRRRHRSRSASSGSDHARVKDADPDPLIEFLGPQPATQTLPRGRGAFKPSNMDSRFQDDYNPSTDVALEQDEEDDWDMALEALKFRKKWRSQGAERLRAAGFTDDEVQRWEKSGDGGGAEKDVDDVRWGKRGEGREWDRGKVLNDDDGVELKAGWAR